MTAPILVQRAKEWGPARMVAGALLMHPRAARRAHEGSGAGPTCRSRCARRRALTATGTLVIVGGENGGRWVGGSDRQIRAAIMSSVVRKELVGFIARDNANDLRVLAELAEQGRLRPVVSHTFPLQEAPMALRRLSEGHAVGKVVVVVEKSHPDGEPRGHGDDERGTRGYEETPRTTDEARDHLREGPTRVMEDSPGSHH